jgi:hypothetical protein
MRQSTRWAALFLGAAAFQARAASLTDLLAGMPPPPADVSAAVGWIRDGQIVDPAYVRFKQSLEAEHAAIVALNGGIEPVLQGTPSIPAGDAPEVQVAAREYEDYVATHSGNDDPTNAMNKRTRWLQGAMGKRLAASTAGPQRDALAREDLKYWIALSGAWASERKPMLERAQATIAATGEGSKATTAEGRSVIARFRAAMLREIEVALSVTELAVRRSWAIETGQVDAISSASRNAKK